jgi:hypothetical protein
MPTPSPTTCSSNSNATDPLRYFSLSLYDSYGDGWQDSEMALYDCDHAVLASGITLDEGFSEQVPLALELFVRLGLAHARTRIRPAFAFPPASTRPFDWW